MNLKCQEGIAKKTLNEIPNGCMIEWMHEKKNYMHVMVYVYTWMNHKVQKWLQVIMIEESNQKWWTTQA